MLTVLDEEAFEALFRRMGFSLDWSISYRTIDDHSRATAQQAFLRNLERGEAYTSEAPGLWAVSYTHLDVYKRQPGSRRGPRPTL